MATALRRTIRLRGTKAHAEAPGAGLGVLFAGESKRVRLLNARAQSLSSRNPKNSGALRADQLQVLYSASDSASHDARHALTRTAERAVVFEMAVGTTLNELARRAPEKSDKGSM